MRTLTFANQGTYPMGRVSVSTWGRFKEMRLKTWDHQKDESPNHPFIHLSIHPSIHESIYLCLSMSIYVCLCLSVSMSIYVYLCLSMSIYISLSLCVSPSLRARIFIQQCYNTNVSSWYLWGFPSLTPNCPKISLSGHTFRICALPWPIAPRSAGILTPMACFVALHCHKNRALS